MISRITGKAALSGGCYDEKNEARRIDIFLQEMSSRNRTPPSSSPSLLAYVSRFAAFEYARLLASDEIHKYAKEEADGAEKRRAEGALRSSAATLAHCNAIQSLVTARRQLFGCTILFAKQSATAGGRFV